MMKSKLLLPENFLYFLIYFSLLFILFRFSIDLNNFGISFEISNLLLSLAMLSSFVLAAVFIIDVFKNNIPGKYLWTLSFLFFGGIAGWFYLKSRSKYEVQS